MRRQRVTRWLAWGLLLALLCGLAAWRVDASGPIETNILTLLPNQSDSPVLAQARQRSRDNFSQQLLVLVTGPERGPARAAAQSARSDLLDAGLEASGTNAQVDAALDVYRRHTFTLLPRSKRRAFREQGAGALATDVAARLASPAGMVSLGRDPGGYMGRFVRSLPRPYPQFTPDGALLRAEHGGDMLYLLRLQVEHGAFASASAEHVADAVATARAAASQACPDCELQATGAALFTNAAKQEAQHEITWLTLVSTVLIMLLIAFVFRSLAPHLLGFVQLLSAVAAAASSVIIVFGSIHILTLVFGTTLLGVVIDYAFLYFAEYWFGDGQPARVMSRVRPGLLVGLLTGVLAFAFMALTGFPALTQIAVFSAAGLLEGALVVALLFPVSLRRTPAVAVHRTLEWPARGLRRARRVSRWRLLIPLLALIVAVPGWFHLHASDDVRDLSWTPPQLMQTDRDIRQTLGRFPASGFYLIRGGDMDASLQREATLFRHLDEQLPDADALGLSRFLPPPGAQQASLAAWRQLMTHPEALKQAFRATGLPGGLATHVRDSWQQAPHTPITRDQLFAAAPDLTRFVLPRKHGTALMASAFASHELDTKTLAAAADGVDGVRFVDPLAQTASTFAHLRVRATWLVIIGYLLICMLLVARYGAREALRVMYPPLVAVGITLGALGWLGEPVNVFVVVALILILGLGRDYAVFLREVGARARAPALAVSLSALTTLLSFGLLAFSRIPALHAFGLATGVGILASVLLAPLSLPPVRNRGDA